MLCYYNDFLPTYLHTCHLITLSYGCILFLTTDMSDVWRICLLCTCKAVCGTASRISQPGLKVVNFARQIDGWKLYGSVISEKSRGFGKFLSVGGLLSLLTLDRKRTTLEDIFVN